MRKYKTENPASSPLSAGLRPPIPSLQSILQSAYNDYLNKLVWILVVLGGISVVFSAARSFRTGWLTVYTVQICILTALILLHVFRKRLHHSLSSWIPVGLLGANAVWNLLSFGLGSMGLTILLSVSIVATAFAGKRAGYIMIGGCTVLIAALGWAIVSGNLRPHAFSADYVLSAPAWLTQIAGFIVYGLLAVVAVSGIQQRLFNLVYEVRSKSEQIREQEAWYRAVFNAPSEAIFLHDADNGAILEVNKAFETMFGYACDDVGSISINDLSSGDPPFSQQEGINRVQAAIKSGPQLFTWRSKRRDGTLLWTEVALRACEIGGNKRVVAVVRDIDERVKMQEKYQLLVENAPTVMWITDEQGATSYISPNVEKIYGFTPTEIYRKSDELWFGRIHPDDLNSVVAAFQRLIADNTVYNVQYRICRKDGGWIWLHDRADTVKSIDGKRSVYGVFSDITMLKQQELDLATANQQLQASELQLRAANQQLLASTAAVRESELRYRTLFESAGDAIFLMSRDRFLECNPRTLAMFGCVHKEIIGAHPADFSPPQQPDGRLSLDKARQTINDAFDGTPQFFEWTHCRKDGTPFEAEVNLNKLVLGDEELLLAIVRDISERKSAERELAFRAELEHVLTSTAIRFINVQSGNIRSELTEVLRAVVEFAGADRSTVWLFDKELRKVSFLAMWARSGITTDMTQADQGLPLERLPRFMQTMQRLEPIVASRADTLFPDEPAFGDVMSFNRIKSILVMPFARHGRLCGFVSVVAVHQYREWSGQIVTLLKVLAEIISNILNRQEMDSALRESEEKYRTLFETISDGIFIADEGGRIVEANEAACRQVGYRRDELLCMSVFDISANPGFSLPRLESRFTSAQSVFYETVHRRKDGSVFPVELGVVKVNYRGSSAYLGMARDTTERKKMQEALRESEQRFRQIADNIQEAFFLLDKASHSVLYVSSAIETILGLSVHAIINRPLQLINLIHPDDRGAVAFADEQQRYAAAHNEEFRIVRPDNEVRWLRLRSFLVHGENGEVYRTAGVVTDITDYKRAQETARQHQQQLIQADKMASIGMMVSGVAHEINNPNNLITLNADVMKTLWQPMQQQLLRVWSERDSVAGLPAVKAVEKFTGMIDGISGAAVRIKRIVQNLKDFARIDSGDIGARIDIREVVDSALSIILNHVKKSTSRFSVSHAAALPPVRGSFQKLEQVIINLVSNACDALDNKNKAVEIRTRGGEDNRAVFIEVRDEGCGIAPEALDKIMDPFFTTKRDKGGTGLGLSVSYGIIKEHGGEIQVASVLGKGTTVSVRLLAAG